ncbi:MAG: putative porin, partial [Bacteroidia bacterium]
IRGDSLDDRDTIKLKQVIRPRTAITHTLQFRDEAGWYYDQDPTSGFYQNVYRDTNETADSSSLWRLNNAVALELFPSWRETVYPLSGSLGIRHEIGRLRNDTIRHDFQNIYAEGLVRLAKPNSMLLRSVEAEGWYVVSGENAGDFRFKANAADKTILVKSLVMQVSAEVSRIQPVYLARHFSGNHFRWINDFSQEGIVRVGGSVMAGSRKTFSWIQLAADVYNYSNPVYFDTTRLPAQLNGNVRAVRLELSHILNLKTFHWRGSAQWNKLPENSVIRLPEFVLRQSFYFEFRLFKKALLMQAGVDAEWFSGYFAQAYNPNIAQFYLQNSQEIGNYLYLDPWVSIRIKPVRVFIKADHVNAGLFGRKYYLAPRYPHNDLALRLGISWVFND